MSLFYKLRHKPVKECEHQGTDMRTVNVGIGHDDDLVVSELTEIEVLGYTGSERSDHSSYLFVSEYLILSSLFYVKYLTS